MIDRILFWLEGGLMHFGIAKIIREKYDCDLFAIVNINKGRKFYENQHLVKFKKVFYYRDCFTKSRMPDLEYLSSLEDRYKINLWNIVYSDINFNKYNPYYKFDRDEILSILEQECIFFERVLDEIKPDFVIMRVTDSSNIELLRIISKSRGIKILTLGFPRFGYRANISPEMDTLDDLDKIQDNLSVKNRTIEELQSFMKGYAKQQSSFKQRFRTLKSQWIKAGFRYLLLISNPQYRKYYEHYNKTIIRVIVNEVTFSLKRRIREFFINHHLPVHIDKDAPFVYFPLSLEPERTLLMPAPFYTNQLEVITNIAKSLPVGYKLYVKEHPMQKIRGWRSTSYYKQIMDLPNVILIHPLVSNEEMVRNCSLTITITGTSGLDAALHKKPSIVLGDVIYSSLPSVHRLRGFEELPQAIRMSLQKKVNVEDLNKFANIIENSSFEFDQTDLINQINDRFFYGGFLFDEDIPISEANSFLEENRAVLEKLALEHIKKIMQYKKYTSKEYASL